MHVEGTVTDNAELQETATSGLTSDDEPYDDNDEESLPDTRYEDLLSFAPKTLRDNQPQILEKIREGLLDPNIQFILLDSPTGTGKSVMAVTAGLASKSGYQSTSNKPLQDQYERDFADLLATLKGRANYKCLRHPIDGETYAVREPNGWNCGNAPCRSIKKYKKTCMALAYENKPLGTMCEYQQAMIKASRSPLVSFNFAAMLAFTNHTSKFGPRNLIVIDEAHNIGGAITNFVELSITQRSLENLDIIGIPDYANPEDYDEFVERVFKSTTSALRILSAKEELDESETKRNEYLERLLKKLVIYRTVNKREENEPSNMAVDKVYDRHKVLEKVMFRPVNVSKIAHDHLFKFAKKTILMSATLNNFDIIIQTLGLPPDKVMCIRVSSPFPKENRPLYKRYVGKLNFQNLDSMTPRLIEVIRGIMEHHKSQKGIIHGTSYRLCTAINEGLRGTGRILFPANASEQPEVLNVHFKSQNPTVLLSPSMTEGIDLKDDLSRFQILVKMPYPSLGDSVVKQRMLLYESYYAVQTGLTLVQAYGRSVRSATDSCITYILDGQFENFLMNNSHVLPPWFLEAIQP